MGLALLGGPAEVSSGEESAPLHEKLLGKLGRRLKLAPSESATVVFVVTWHFPNLKSIPGVKVQGRYYGSRFDSALAVAAYVAKEYPRLSARRCYGATHGTIRPCRTGSSIALC